MAHRIILFAILTSAALCLSQTSAATPAPTLERVIICPGTNPVGVLVTSRSGVVRVHCTDGIYTLEQAGTGRLWDEGE